MFAGLQRQYGNRSLANALQRTKGTNWKAESEQDFDDRDDFAEIPDDEAVYLRKRTPKKTQALSGHKRASPPADAARKGKLRAAARRKAKVRAQRVDERERQAARKREHVAQEDERLAKEQKVLAQDPEFLAQEDAELFDRSLDMYAEAELLILDLVRDSTHQQCLERVDKALDIHKELERKSPGKRYFGPLFTLWRTIITDVEQLLTQQEQEQREREARTQAEREQQEKAAKEKARLEKVEKLPKRVANFQTEIATQLKTLDAAKPPTRNGQKERGRLTTALYSLRDSTRASFTRAQRDELDMLKKQVGELIASLPTAQTTAKPASLIDSLPEGDPRLNSAPRLLVHRDALVEAAAPINVAMLKRILAGTAEKRTYKFGVLHSHIDSAQYNILYNPEETPPVVLGFVHGHMETNAPPRVRSEQQNVYDLRTKTAQQVAIIDDQLYEIV